MTRAAPSPLVSVVIPTFNHQQFLAASVESVFSQTYKNIELIIVDDGSTDNTGALIDLLRLHFDFVFVKQPNKGQATARNRGLALARGTYIAFLDDDDVFSADKISWQLIDLVGGSASAVFGTFTSFESPRPEDLPFALETSNSFGKRSFELRRRDFLRANPIRTPGQGLFVTDCLRAIGGFDESLRGSDDWDAWIRLSKRNKIVFRNRLALHYRVHTGNSSRNTFEMLLNTEKVIKKTSRDFTGYSRWSCAAHGYRFLLRRFGVPLLFDDSHFHKRRSASCTLSDAWRFVDVFGTRFFIDPLLMPIFISQILKRLFGAMRPAKTEPDQAP